jgi:hypothetical protein
VGTPFFGDRGLDRLQNRNSDEMMVSLDFVDDTGETHNLTRTRKRDLTTITYDGITARQSDLNSAFGDKDIFLSIFNPLYFINVLGDSGKGLLEKMLPVVKHEDVMAALPEYTQGILENQSLRSPETFIKQRRSELKKLEETLIGYRSQMELLENQKEERAGSINDMRTAIETIAGEMAELVTIRDNDRDISAEEAKLSELRKSRNELLDVMNNGADKAMRDIQDEIKAVKSSISQQSEKQYSSSYTKQILEAETGLKALYDEHARLKVVLADTVVGYTCPTCASVITDENIDAVKSDLQCRLMMLINDGKTSKVELDNLVAIDNAAKYKFDGQKAQILTCEQNKLDELNQQIQEINIARELDSEDYGIQLAMIESQIEEQKYQLANGNLTEEQILNLSELKETKKGYEAKIEALNEIKEYDYTPQITETETKISELKCLINEAIQYMTKRIELMLDGLKMNKTEIVLTEIVKTTGEIKDCFRFSYDGRDYRCLSLSEKVRAGLEIAVLIQKLSGREYPIFIDNGESICSFGNVDLTGQIILSRVVKGQELQVTFKNRESLQMAA